MSYKFVMDYTLHDPSDTAVWRGHVLDDEEFIVCEVWNNGDGGGNFYAWHNAEARWSIEDEAIRNFTGEDEQKMEYYRLVDTDSPMDVWIEELRGKDEETA